MTINTFKAGLPAEHDLRKSLTSKPVTSVRLLMDRIDKYRRIEGSVTEKREGEGDPSREEGFQVESDPK